MIFFLFWHFSVRYNVSFIKIIRISMPHRLNVFFLAYLEDMDMDTMITTYNTAVTDAASEILGKERRRKKPWVTKDVLDLCDERRDLKKKRYEAEGAKEYREANRRIQKAVKKAKEDWIGAQCEEIETCLNKNKLASLKRIQ